MANSLRLWIVFKDLFPERSMLIDSCREHGRNELILFSETGNYIFHFENAHKWNLECIGRKNK